MGSPVPEIKAGKATSELKQGDYVGCSQGVMTFLPQVQFGLKYEHFGRGLEHCQRQRRKLQ